MVNYQNGKIYKLLSNQTEKIYIGSTTEKYLSQRLCNHKNDYNLWLQGKKNYITSFELIEYEDCKIELIENYSCNDVNELHQREQYWINQFQDIIVNKCNAYGINKIKHKISKNKYRQTDKYRITEKIYRTTEKYKNYQKKYKDTEKFKQMYQNWANKPKICIWCDKLMKLKTYSTHKKTKKHITNKEWFIKNCFEQLSNI